MKVVSIFVLYKPDLNMFAKVLKSISNQVDECIIVNNGEENLVFSNFINVEVITLGKNLGIAYAQNRGIERAIEIDADYVLLSDQDTIYPEKYIESLFTESKSYDFDALCPLFYDEIKNESAPIMLTKFSYIKSVSEPVYVEHSIASGTLISINILKKIGLMNEKLFIDYVDFEWCWRLKNQGGKMLCCPKTIIKHRLGDDYKKILGRKVCIRSNFRYYYMIRNGLKLSLYYPILTVSEKFKLFKKTFMLSVAVFLLRHNFETLKVILKATKDGVKNEKDFWN